MKLCDSSMNKEERPCIETVHVTHGLPGSGKSFWATEFRSGLGRPARRLDIDKMMRDAKKSGSDKSFVYRRIRKELMCFVSDIIIDGLFLTNKDIVELLKETVLPHMDTHIMGTPIKIEVVVDSWDENRKACIANDRDRGREQSAETTIKNAPYEKIDVELLKKETGLQDISVCAHEVYERPAHVKFFNDAGIYPPTDGKLRSDEWCLGGAYGNCWDDTMSPVLSETPPTIFTKLADVLDTIDKHGVLRMRDLTEIMQNLVTTETRTSYDYYGGQTSYACYCVDVKELYDFLEEKGVIGAENEYDERI